MDRDEHLHAKRKRGQACSADQFGPRRPRTGTYLKVSLLASEMNFISDHLSQMDHLTRSALGYSSPNIDDSTPRLLFSFLCI